MWRPLCWKPLLSFCFLQPWWKQMLLIHVQTTEWHSNKCLQDILCAVNVCSGISCTGLHFPDRIMVKIKINTQLYGRSYETFDSYDNDWTKWSALVITFLPNDINHSQNLIKLFYNISFIYRNCHTEIWGSNIMWIYLSKL